MGTTMAFYQIQNRNFTQNELKDIMGQTFGYTDRDDEDDSLDCPTILYQESAKWLPFYDEDICEGYIASHEDAMKLSIIFSTPVLAFSVFDSDILFVSYADTNKNIHYNYAKPNIDGYDEFDIDLYKTAFPTFLLDFCLAKEKEAFDEIWNGEEVFSENRMECLCELIGATPVYDEIPEGFQGIFG